MLDVGRRPVKGVRIRRAIEARGAHQVYLPPYSPDFNSIEMVFTKIKQDLCSLACRTRDTVWAAMQSVLELVVPSDAINCFARCGYTLRVE